MAQFSIPIRKVVELLAMEVDTKMAAEVWQRTEVPVRCPFCGDGGYHMSINTDNNTFRCVKCGEGGGTLDLYSMVRMGRRADKTTSKELFLKLKQELGLPKERLIVPREQPRCREVLPAKNAVLDKAYSTLLTLPFFTLSVEHIEALKKRGLDDMSILKNQYCTIPPAKNWVSRHSLYDELRPVAERIFALRDRYPRLADFSVDMLTSGLLIARELLDRGCILKGVPGAFFLEGHWLMPLQSGMLIPTRTMATVSAPKGRIVGLQVRLDTPRKTGLRYMTISSKGLPKGPTTGMSRLHFPRGNARISERTRVYLTEGPLKSDVASSLMPWPSVFIAIPGVSATKSLPALAKLLKSKGVSVVYNALDMDKLTNINVARGSRKIRGIFEQEGITFKPLFWDDDYTKRKDRQLQQIFAKHSMSYPAGEIHIRIARACALLHEAHIDHAIAKAPSGETVKSNWRNSTKGIDDWLLYQRDRGR